jgi:putative peptidoglycan lipid II flippase
MRLFRNLSVISAMTLLSRIAGFVREILTAAFLGAGPVADTFFQALTIPNTFRRIFAEGAFNAAFVPLYAKTMEGEGQTEADQFAREALSALVTATAFIVLIFQITAPWLAYLFFPGAIGDPNALAFGAMLLQITMPYLLTMSILALISGALNSHGKFAAAAGAPVFFNLVLIAILAVDFYEGAALATALAIGVTVSGLLQAGVIYIAARQAGIAIRWTAPRLTPKVKRLIALGVPGALAAGVTQINVLVTSSIAMLETGARSWLNYAERLYQLPLGVIGIAMGIALLPNLARRVRAGDDAGGLDIMNRSIELALAFTLPAAVTFYAIPEFLINGLYERLRFTADDTIQTATALRVFALGVPAFILIKVLQPGFFAREDTRTPMFYSLVGVVLNFVLAVTLFFGPMGFVGLAIASTAAGWATVILLAVTLNSRGYLKPDAQLISRLIRLGVSSGLMGVSVWGLAHNQFPALPALSGVTGLLIVVPIGGVIYGLACLGSGALRPREIMQAFRPSKDAPPALDTD